MLEKPRDIVTVQGLTFKMGRWHRALTWLPRWSRRTGHMGLWTLLVREEVSIWPWGCCPLGILKTSPRTVVSVLSFVRERKKESQWERCIFQQRLNKHCTKKCIYSAMPLERLYFMGDGYSVFYILVLSETGFISLQSKGLSRVFSSTTVRKNQWNCRKTKTQK